MSVLCAHCGQPVQGAAPNVDGERWFHDSCYALEFPPQHPEQWPKPITAAMSEDELWSGTMKPRRISQVPHDDDEWADHHGR